MRPCWTSPGLLDEEVGGDQVSDSGKQMVAIRRSARVASNPNPASVYVEVGMSGLSFPRRSSGQINDDHYAETFSHSRWKSSSWGPRRIKQAEVILKIRAEFAASATANTIVVQMALPTYTSRVSFELELGAVGQTTDFKEANKRLEWNLKKIVGGAEHTLRAKLTFSHESHGNLTKEAGPVTMSFTIPMFNASRLQLWDVLSNDEVVSIALKNKEMAAKTLVEEAAAAWKTRFPRAKVDDCTVVCLFFQDREDSLLSHTTKDISPHIHK